MSQQIPAPPEPKTSSRVVAALLIGLVVGLGIGIVIGDLVLSTHNGAGTNNQVQVSGTVPSGTTGNLLFSNMNETMKTSASIINGEYSVLLVGGQSYNIELSEYPFTDYNPFYVPLGVTTFTENLVPSR